MYIETWDLYRPVHDKVEGETVGPAHPGLVQHLPVAPVQPSPLYAGVAAPVRPEYPPSIIIMALLLLFL